jgi:hypothetical protein
MIFCLHLAKPLHNLIGVIYQEQGFAMNKNFKTIIYMFFFAILLSHVPNSSIKAQHVTEPPIPIYIVCPYHQDSLRNAYENSIAANGFALAYTIKNYDTLQMQVQKSSSENSTHFAWLYTLIALLGTMNIILLLSTSRIRKELAQLKRHDHHQMLTTPVQPVELRHLPEFQEALFTQKPTEIHKPTRTRRIPAKKLRS